MQVGCCNNLQRTARASSKKVCTSAGIIARLHLKSGSFDDMSIIRQLLDVPAQQISVLW